MNLQKHDADSTGRKRSRPVRRWIRRGFITWAVVSTAWLANSVRTQGVRPSLLESSPTVTVINDDISLRFVPTSSKSGTGLLFLCGSGIAAEAYAPLLRPIAEAGHPVFILRLPMRFAPLDSHKQQAIDRAFELMRQHSTVNRWVLSGHSLGAALACRIVLSHDTGIAGLVLLGTTHPKEADLSQCRIPVAKVYATNDGIAAAADVLANRHLLPASTTWVAIRGGNHSQFGHYGHQLFDGTATISRSDQQDIARSGILDLIEKADGVIADD